MPKITMPEWAEFFAIYPDAHILQTPEWGDIKSNFHWEVARFRHTDCGAQVLLRHLPLGFKVAYIPMGPIGNMDHWDELLAEIDEFCRGQRVVFLKVELDSWDIPNVSDLLIQTGFISSPHTIQPTATILINLRETEDSLLAKMKQKTRYNIRLAARKGVTISESKDINAFYKLMEETGNRDGFGIHTKEYYQYTYDAFSPSGRCQLFFAEFVGKILAGLMVFIQGRRSWYFYGASGSEHRELMPNYLLQWEAIKWARLHGCQDYDLWGVPDEDIDTLEANFTRRSDGLWGVYRFKRGWGGRLVHSSGAWDRIYSPRIYQLYDIWTRRRASEGIEI